MSDLGRMRKLLTSAAVAVLLASSVQATEPSKPASAETVVIDSVHYQVPAKWIGRKVDSSLWAKHSDLVALPQHLTFESSRIYVTHATRDAFVKMAEAAAKDSVTLLADSGYRSPKYQREIIRRRLTRGDSIEEIFRSASPPGYSEHHTGRALDLVPSEANFADTPAYAWLKHNAARFGFHESYPENGPGHLPWESWHWCYQPK